MAITLSKDELKKLLTIGAWLAFSVFAVIVLIRVNFSDTTLPRTALLSAATASISFSVLSILLVMNLKWTMPFLARLANRPIVHGVWWGELNSIYKGKHLPPIPIAFVVRQTYVTLSIQSFTADIGADSIIEVFDRNPKTSDVRLKYVYEMKRQANKEHKFTTGYGDLKLEDGGAVLRGVYWTNSPTEGSIHLRLLQRQCDGINCFESAQRIAKSKMPS